MATMDDGAVVHTFLSLVGAIDSPTGELIERIDWPGIDGQAYRKLGKKGQAFRVVGTVDLDNTGGIVATQIDTYKGMIGKLVDITDDLGMVYDNLMVLNMRPIRSRELVNAAGGLSTDMKYLLIVEFVLEATEIL